MGSNILIKGINDLKTVNPALASEWDAGRNGNTGPEDVMAGSEKKIWWKCSLGHSWRAAVYSRNSAGNGCPYCAGQKVLPGFNDLATRNPALALEWDHEKNAGIAPSEFSKGSDQKVWWICKHNHSWKATISSRTSGVGCPQCAKELQSSFPEKAIYYYVKKIFPDTVPGFKDISLETFELDV